MSIEAAVERIAQRPLQAVAGWLSELSGNPIDMGRALPETAPLRPIPGHATYRYAAVDGHRVIVDAGTRRIIYIVD